VNHACAACTNSNQCAAGEVCCDGGACKLAGTCQTQVGCAADAECGAGQKCCNKVCVTGDCCASADCQPPYQCLQNACQKCSGDAQCGLGEKCCGGACQKGACCPGAPCPGGEACIGYTCQDCKTDTECSAGNKCCGGRCRTGATCCADAECAPFLCIDSQCAACQSDGQCATGSKCCGGACVAGAQCCAAADCPAGQLCAAGQCVGCQQDLDCGAGSRCCGGACRQSDCCSRADCPAGQSCTAWGCGACVDSSQCAAGQVCCSGGCFDGTCCQDSECAATKKCIGHGCKPCTTSEQCLSNETCCDGSCKIGSCCTTAQCDGQICEGNVCRSCAAHNECGAGARCCDGTCYPNLECCGAADCSGGKACIAGKCSACTGDAQCGLGKRCCDGVCAMYCQTVREWDSEADFSYGMSDNLTQEENNRLDPTCGKGKLCLNPIQKVENPVIWIPDNAHGTIFKFDTRTGERFPAPGDPVYPNGFPTFGGSPSRTAVDPINGGVWVGNRSGNLSVTHLDKDGKILCSRNLGELVRAVAMDAHGDVWASASGNYLMYKLSGSLIDNDLVSPPTCKVLGHVGLPGYAYGAGMGDGNKVWVLDVSSGQSLMEIDVNTNAVRQYKPRTPQCPSSGGFYGMTVDSDYVWIGAYYCGAVVRCSIAALHAAGDGGVIGNPGCVSFVTGCHPRGTAVAQDGFVYSALDGCNGVAKIARNGSPTDPASISIIGTSVTPTGAAIDRDGNLWAVSYNSQGAERVDLKTGAHAFFASGGPPYAYSDMTGMQAVMAALIPGRWTAVYDSLYLNPSWIRAEVTAKIPSGTSVTFRARSAASLTTLENAEWTTSSALPADLSSVPRHRYLQTELTLQSDSYDKTPVVDAMRVLWGP
jgi:hypothetical protein